MTTPQIIAFSAKITSYEAYAEACNQARCRTDAAHDYGVTGANFASDLPYSDTYIRFHRNEIAKVWHHHRELLRRVYNVYPARSTTMQTVIAAFKLEPFHINISREDPAMVIFTQSADDGRADRQVRTTFGKLIRKLCPSLTDDDVRKLEAAHRSETDPTFEVARTIEEIYRVYTEMDGDSGCMRYGSDHWTLAKPGHPCNAYCAPGMGVAYTEDEDGNIKSRAVIWDNPADAADKRYVRIYGDGVLRVKLERAGYIESHLAGALLSAHPVSETGTGDCNEDCDEDCDEDHDSGRARISMPYLDGPGGAQSDTQGSYVARFPEDNGMLRVISRKTADAITKALGQGYVGDCKTTNGYVEVAQHDASAFAFTCALSGETSNSLVEPRSVVSIYLEGVVQRALAPAATTAGYSYTLVDWNETTRAWIQVWVNSVDDNNKSFYCPRIGRMVNSDKNKRAAGYDLLSVELGYEPDQWVKGAYRVGGAGVGVELYARQEDTTRVYNESGYTGYFHGSQIAALKTTGNYVAVLPCNNQKYLAHKDYHQLVTLPSSKRALKDVHALKARYDGVWDLTRNLKPVRWFGVDVWVAKDSVATDVPESFVRDVLVLPRLNFEYDNSDDSITEAGVARVTRKFLSAVNFGWHRFSAHTNYNELASCGSYNGSSSWTSSKTAANLIAGMTDEALEAKFWPGISPCAHAWAKVVITLDDALKVFISRNSPDIYSPLPATVEVPVVAEDCFALAV